MDCDVAMVITPGSSDEAVTLRCATAVRTFAPLPAPGMFPVSVKFVLYVVTATFVLTCTPSGRGLTSEAFPMEVVFENARRLRLRGDFDDAAVRRLVAILERRAP